VRSRMGPGIHYYKAREDQELGPGDAHPQQHNLDENQTSMPFLPVDRISHAIAPAMRAVRAK